MDQTARYVLVALLGGTSIYCTSAAMDGSVGDAGVSRADAAGAGEACETCAVEQPTVIFDDEITPTTQAPGSTKCFGPEWDVGAFKTVVVYDSNRETDTVYWWHGAGAGYVSNGAGGNVFDTRLGSKLRTSATCGVPLGVTVVGFATR